MKSVVENILLGLGLGALTGWLGWRSGFLYPSGAVGVLVVSMLTFFAGGWAWGVVSLVFFASSNLWSRFRAAHKKSLGEQFGKGARRSWEQILARAGWSVILALIHALAARNITVFAAFVGSLATASADAWATELGVLNPRPPRLVTTGRRVLPGTPGAISVLGIMAALGASWLIGLVGLLLSAIKAWLDKTEWDPGLLWLPLAAMIGGVAGCLTDSLLGATAQGIYYCEHCDKRTEERLHTCGEVAQQIRGWSWLTNDGVNLVSSIVGAAVTAGAVAWLAQTRVRW